jgi:hypothetical protein
MRRKIAVTVGLALVYLIPMHFKLQRSTHGEMEAIRFGFQWFGYMVVLGATWSDITDMYREHIEGHDDG